MRAICCAFSSVQVSVAGFQTSASLTAPLSVNLAPLKLPPIARTSPFGSMISFWNCRAMCIGAAGVTTGAGPFRSIVIALFDDVLVLMWSEPPATRILPSRYMTEMPSSGNQSAPCGPILVIVPSPVMSSTCMSGTAP